MRRLVILVMFASACDCGGTKLLGVNPCDTGTVTGRACAPDARTWVAGAAVDVTGSDCHGQPFDITATTKADGTFELDGVPNGPRTVDVKAGRFQTSYDVKVAANATTHIPDNQLCFAHDATHIAVVTGKGDHIETLLTGMGLTVDKTYDGTSSGWSTSAQPFLMDRSQLGQYDVLFIDCAAAENGSTHRLDLGDAQTIAGNLRDFVAGGGSVYASDWAFIFLALAWPDDLPMLTHDSSPIASPFDPYELMGFKQTIQARIADPGLASALGKSQLTVAFPLGHWGLVTDAAGGATSLVDGTAVTCQGSSRSPLSCSQAGPPAINVPLALTFAPTPDDPSKQGRVTYTSFHNISQPTGDVEAFLKYLVFRL